MSASEIKLRLRHQGGDSFEVGLVTQSVRAGIEVVVRVFDGDGVELRAEPAPTP
jgi:hypothetical protein